MKNEKVFASEVAMAFWRMIMNEPERLDEIAHMIYMDISPDELKEALWTFTKINTTL